MNDRKCLRCSGTRLEAGVLDATGRTSFKLEKAKFLTWHTSDIEVKAFLCLACGSIELEGDVKKAMALKPE
ncbi:MAG TPA: hypothetical protein PLX89_08760 [Verrucomicrobiota bacterium]|nr:hypothetical protein [Verrucomicrobiales bacterium]HRI13083.1 hypothetical protein [Verrucomicrobiota bacterium]